MEYFSNEGKNVVIEFSNKVYTRHVIKVPFIPLGSNLNDIIEKYVVPIYKEGDLLYISKKLASICSSGYIHKDKIAIGRLAPKIATKIHLIPGGNSVANCYAMQVAIYMVGLPNIAWAALAYYKWRDKFIEAAGSSIGFLSGLDGRYFSEYADIVIMPPINSGEICSSIRKNYGITCFIASANERYAGIIATSRDLKIPSWKLEKIIADNPLGEGDFCTPLCIIRTEE